MTQTTDEFLAHYGVKGMKWGVRKDDEYGDKLRFHGPEQGPSISHELHDDTKVASKEVVDLIGQRYGFNIKEVVAMGPGHPEYEAGTMGYVQLGSGKANEGTIFVSTDDLKPALKASEDMGWLGKDCGHAQSFLTHEAAHAIFHAPVRNVQGFFGVKQVGGNLDARNVAIQAAIKESLREGIPEHLFLERLSGYAAASGSREEAEAEMFSQYHWGSDSPNYVKVWGETLHREMGLDSTPFKEMR